MAETVLVTGATGFVGGWCVVEILKRGYAVRAALRDPAKEGAVRAMAVAGGADPALLNVCKADLTDDAGWDEAAKGCSYVLHVASPLRGDSAADPASFIAPARDGTLRVLAAATKAGVRRVVMTSAAAAARVPIKSKKKISDETIWADPSDPRFDAYRRSKILAERAAWDFMAGKTTELTAILPSAVFGPVLATDKLGSVGIIAGLLRGRPSLLPKLGFWIVDVRDLALLHVAAMTAPEAAGERFIAAGEFLWFSDVAKILRARLGRRASKVPVRELPNFVARLLALFSPQLRSLVPELGRRNALTAEKARRLLGFAPRPVADTLADCAQSLIDKAR